VRKPQQQGKPAHGRLGDDQKPALVEMIGRKTRPGQQKELRRENWSAMTMPNGRGVVMRELGQHEPVLGRALHPRPHVGDECARAQTR